MHRTLKYQITEREQGHTVQQYLKAKGYSSQSLIRLKKKPEFVLLNGVPVFLSCRLHKDDLLTIQIVENASSEKIQPIELPLHILYEDEDLMVIDKPAGMPIHPSMHNYDNSVANALAWYFQRQNIPFVFRCINRLDRDTSGLTLIAKHFVSAGMLSAMVTASEESSRYAEKPVQSTLSGEPLLCAESFVQPSVSDEPLLCTERSAQSAAPDFPCHPRKGILRQYLAIVRGCVTPLSGTILAPLGRKPGSVIERVVDFEKGERAVTHYHVLEQKNGYSLVSLELETGRTHQIRIHMKYIGFPLIGDYLYNPDMELIGRQALHSCRLSFVHPITGNNMVFTAPLPEDMRKVLEPF